MKFKFIPAVTLTRAMRPLASRRKEIRGAAASAEVFGHAEALCA
jgi:hypothetical protein